MTTNLYKIGLWAEDKGLVGEKETFITGAVVCASNKPIGFGIESPAGSGKTVAADLLLGDGDKKEGLIESTEVYYKDAGSETSFFRDASTINQKKIVFFKELQKDKTHSTVEAVKSLTEGKSAGRRRTDVTKDEVVADKVEPKTVVYTLAVENDTKPDAELRRRCISIATDVSKEQTQKVLDTKSKMRFDPEGIRKLTDAEAEKIKKDYNSIRRAQFKVKNPFAPVFAQVLADIAPDQKIRSVAEHLWEVMEGITKLNFVEGRVAVGDDGLTLLSNVQDLFQALDIYKHSFLREVFSVPPIGDIVLKGFERVDNVVASEKPGNSDLTQYTSQLPTTRWYDVNHLRKAIHDNYKIVLAKQVVNQICRQLVDAGYLEDYREGQTVLYKVEQQFKDLERPDWQWLVEQTAPLVKEKFPEQFGRWYEMQWKSYQHPVTGDEVTWQTKLTD